MNSTPIENEKYSFCKICGAKLEEVTDMAELAICDAHNPLSMETQSACKPSSTPIKTAEEILSFEEARLIENHLDPDFGYVDLLQIPKRNAINAMHTFANQQVLAKVVENAYGDYFQVVKEFVDSAGWVYTKEVPHMLDSYFESNTGKPIEFQKSFGVSGDNPNWLSKGSRWRPKILSDLLTAFR